MRSPQYLGFPDPAPVHTRKYAHIVHVIVRVGSRSNTAEFLLEELLSYTLEDMIYSH
jgi:hypothetical protein